MEGVILQILEKIGYLGVFLLITIENIFPPIPSEVILLFSGFMTTYTSLKLPLIILFSTLGSFLGAIILYLIGRMINKERLKTLISGKIGKILKLEQKDIDRADDWFERRGNITVFFCRFIPIVRSLISIPAGMNKMNIFNFSFYTIIATLIWNSILSYLGSVLGENWVYLASILDKYSFIVLMIIIASVIVLLFIYYKKRIKKKYKSKDLDLY